MWRVVTLEAPITSDSPQFEEDAYKRGAQQQAAARLCCERAWGEKQQGAAARLPRRLLPLQVAFPPATLAVAALRRGASLPSSRRLRDPFILIRIGVLPFASLVSLFASLQSTTISCLLKMIIFHEVTWRFWITNFKDSFEVVNTFEITLVEKLVNTNKKVSLMSCFINIGN